MARQRAFSTRPTSLPDYVFLGTALLILVFGFVILTSASSDLGAFRFGDGYFYLKRQILNGLSIGLAGFLLGAFVCYRRWERAALPFLILSVVLLLLLFTPLGLSTKGATRWLDFGLFSFQPSEILKLTFIMYVASWVGRHARRRESFIEGFLPLCALFGGVGILLLLQPATTTTVIILLSAILVYFAGGAKIRYLGLMGLIGALVFSGIILVTPYRLERVKTFFEPEVVDALGAGYHREQALTAIGSGGVFGVGYGDSTTKLYYLPEPIGDSVFAVLAEEMGFVGSSFLLLLFFVLIFRGFMIARNVKDDFGRLVVLGFVGVIGFQVFVNVGAISGVLPLTGVPLPFVSFGGSALAVFMTIGGIIFNISRYRR